jgi:predicted alpha-1,2-mannosidase
MKTLAATLVLMALLSDITSAKVHRQKEPVDYVSPNIGGIGQLLTATVPYVQRPHGMARLAPITTPGISDRYLADKIYGFPIGAATLMASVGEVGTHPELYASDFDHDFETATPYYYEADLQTWGIKSEFTATEQAAYYRFTFPASLHAHLVISAEDDAKLEVTGDDTLQGSQRIAGPVGKIADTDKETREYFCAKFSRPLHSYQTWKGNDLSHAAGQTGDNIGIVSDTGTTAGEQIEVRVGISYISTEQARRNLEREISRETFDQVKSQTREIWNSTMSGIDVTGGTERQRTIFYTALYRSLGRMTDITEDGKYFSGYDHAVHDAGGHDFYIDDGLWDTYRSLHPLQLLLNSGQQEDMVRSYLRMYEQNGWLPSFPSVAGEQAVMIGHHAAEFILDVYAKGYHDFDVEEAYTAIRKNATEATLLPWSRGPLTSLDRVYFEKGFFPALDWG